MAPPYLSDLLTEHRPVWSLRHSEVSALLCCPKSKFKTFFFAYVRKLYCIVFVLFYNYIVLSFLLCSSLVNLECDKWRYMNNIEILTNSSLRLPAPPQLQASPPNCPRACGTWPCAAWSCSPRTGRPRESCWNTPSSGTAGRDGTLLKPAPADTLLLLVYTLLSFTNTTHSLQRALNAVSSIHDAKKHDCTSPKAHLYKSAISVLSLDLCSVQNQVIPSRIQPEWRRSVARLLNPPRI